MKNLNFYLVGGAVRDQIMGVPSSDKDYVVVGATPKDMKQAGFKQVGKSFPVFLHPKTHDEYALARIDKKTGVGYNGFDVDFSPNISLEEDLLRRDLTINAIAYDGINYIDPYGGIQDIQNCILRPTSAAFKEDPLRLLRLARFKARYPHFTIHPLCYDYAKDMKDELCHLKPERIRQEIEKDFKEEKPSLFFKTLKDLNILDEVFPQVFQLNTFEQALTKLDEIKKQTDNLACLLTGLLDQSPFVEDFLTHFGYQKEKKIILTFIKNKDHIEQFKKLSTENCLAVIDAFKIRKKTDPTLEFLFICAKTICPSFTDDAKIKLFTYVDLLEKIDYSPIIAQSKNPKEDVYRYNLKLLNQMGGDL